MSRRVGVLAVENVAGESLWEHSACDLAIEASRELLQAHSVQGLFVASPSAMVDSASNHAALFADRLGLGPDVEAFELEAGDASGAAALHAAYAHVAAGLARNVLVLGVSKVTDQAEGERRGILDRFLDPEVEGALGVSYSAAAGVLANLYMTTHGLERGALAHITAKNIKNACTGGETFHSAALSAEELARDLPVSPPLVRSDFAPLFDGATALIVGDLAELDGRPAVEILSVASSCDVNAIAEREEPLRFLAVERAAERALRRAGFAGLADLRTIDFFEIHNASTIVEVLATESLGLSEPGRLPAMCRDGFGGISSECPINPGGGQQGRGLLLGGAGLEQAREAFLQITGAAGSRQIETKEDARTRGLAVSICGLGTQAFATTFGSTTR